MLIHPSREVRYDCSKPKGECLHSSYLHTKSRQSDNNSRVPTMYLLCICPSPHDYIRSRFHKQLQQPKQRKSHLTCLRHCKTVQISVKENMKANSQQSFLFRFKIQFKAVSTSYTVQAVSIDLQQYMVNSNTSTTAIQTKDAT